MSLDELAEEVKWMEKALPVHISSHLIKEVKYFNSLPEYHKIITNVYVGFVNGLKNVPEDYYLR